MSYDYSINSLSRNILIIAILVLIAIYIQIKENRKTQLKKSSNLITSFQKIVPSVNTRNALAILMEWQQKEMIYNLFLHEIDAFYEFEKFEDIDVYFNFDFEEIYKDQFLSFASDPSGGQYSLWYYPDLVGEPPVVFIGSEAETNLIASNLEDFVLLFTQGKILDARNDKLDTAKDLWREMYNFELEDVANDLGLSPEEAKEKLNTSIIKFREFVHSAIREKPFENIFSDLAKQPDFVAWVNKIREKHEE